MTGAIQTAAAAEGSSTVVINQMKHVQLYVH